MKKSGKQWVLALTILVMLLSLLTGGIGAGSTVQAKAKIKLNKTDITMLRYHTYQLKVKGTKAAVTWTSSNDNMATVDEQGTVTAVSEGSAKIKAKVGRKILTCKLTIIDPDKKDVLAAYGYQALKKALPKNAGLKVKSVLTGTSLQNKDMAYFDCTFQDAIGRHLHAYIEVYKDFGESLSYHTVTTSFYQENIILHFHEHPLDTFSLSKCKKADLSGIKDLSKTLFKLEKITVKKGENFDKGNSWITL